MPNQVIIAQNVHVTRAVHGPADLVLVLTDVSGDDFRVALSTAQAERLAALLDANTRSEDA